MTSPSRLPPLVVRGRPENLNIGPPESGAECGSAHIGGAKSIRLDGQPYTVIGVTPEGFSGLNALIAPDIWLPLGVFSQLGSAFSISGGLSDLEQPKNYTLNLVARLRPGLTIEAAKPRLPTPTSV